MLSRFTRAAVTRVLTPVARGLLRAGISPDVVTVVGTVGVCVGALGFYPRGEFLAGTLVITAFVFADTLDGTMARLSGRSSSWGAFLDSVLDRFGDAAVFGGLVLWFAGSGDDLRLAALALACLALGAIVPYTKARAEGLGITSGRLKSLGLVDKVVAEPLGGAHRDPAEAAKALKKAVQESLRGLQDRQARGCYCRG